MFIAPIAFHNIGWRTYIIFAATNFAIVPLVYFFYPETAYRSLEEVDVLFHLANISPGNPWLNVVKISLREPLWFGKKGNEHFDYEQSEWHQQYLQITSSGSGTTLEGSGNQREKTDNGDSGGGIHGHTNTPNATDIGRAVVPLRNEVLSPTRTNSGLSEKRLREQQHHSHLEYQRQRNIETRNSAGTGTTAVSGSQYSERPPLPEAMQESYRSERSAFSDPNWAASEMAPPPLRVPSRDSTVSHRSNGASVDHPGHVPRRLRTYSDDEPLPPSLARTPSGRTPSSRHAYTPDHISDSPIHYLPDSVEQEVRAVLGRNGVVLGDGDRIVLGAEGRAVVRNSAGSRSSSVSHMIARDAGRGH